MVKVFVNGKEVDVDVESTLLNAIVKAGYEVPTLCYLKGIFNEATCRVCIVEISGGRLVPACAYPVSEGLKVFTDSERVLKYRRAIIELILASHKIKCQSCSMKGGYCQLLKLSKDYGVEGIPVCSECKLYGSECLLARGIPCLGPITIAGCSAVCTNEYSQCIGCRGPVSRYDVLKEGVELYVKYGIDVNEVLRLAELFWSSLPIIDTLRGLLRESKSGGKA